MSSITHKILAFLAAGILLSLASRSWAEGYVASLVDDFDISTNSAASTWSYSIGVPSSNYLLPINTKTVSGIFSPPVWTSAQQVWADSTPSWAYWMIGKNTTGAAITGPIWGDILDWQADTVMLYPGNPTQGQNLLVSWLAPADMIVDANWTFTRIAERGPGREQYGAFGTVYRVTLRNSTGDTTLVDFGTEAAPSGVLHDSVSSSLAGLGVMAGDRLFWETKGFNNTADCDATGASIVITEAVATSSACDMLTFGPGAVITGTAIAWTLPYGTDVTTLAPTYVISALATCSPASGAPVDFTSPVIYTVTAEDHSSKAYTVTVTVTPGNSEKDLLSFGPGAIITGTDVAWTLPYGTDVTVLAPIYTVSALATGSPASGEPADFTNPVSYTVTAQDGSTREYTVTVTVVPVSSENDMLAFGPGAIITGTDIAWTVPYGTDVTSLQPVCDVSALATCSPASRDTVDFTNPVSYTVTAQDGSTREYTVTVTVVPVSSENGMLAFGPGAIITGTDIAWTVPYGTDVTSLTPACDVSALATCSPVSGDTVDFTNPVNYTVTAQDGSPRIYTVTVSVAQSGIYEASLANDFDINDNSATSTWSFYVGTPASMRLLPTNARTVYDIFSPPSTPCPQRVWADSTPSWAYWMIGKNTTGAAITAPYWGDTLDWQPNTVMLHPGSPTAGQNLIVSWLAPQDMIVDANWIFTRLSERGAGREQYGAFGTVYRVTLRTSTGDTTLVDFGTEAAPSGVLHDSVSASLTGLSVMAGDRLFWETKGFNGTADCDATGAAIVIAKSSGGASYATWAVTNSPGQAAGQDYDSDGVQNGMEYFMGVAPGDLSFTALPGLDPGGKITWPMSPAFSGIYQVQSSPDLSAWTDRTRDPVWVTTNADSVVCMLPPAAGRLFVRLVVTPN